jgi:hypothetical protein
VKTRTAPIAALAVALVLAVVGASCSSTNPVALQVGDWQLSTTDLKDQLDSFAAVYAKAQPDGSDKDLWGTGPGTWSTNYTSSFLSDQLNLQLAQIAVQQRGLEVTDDDRASARTSLEQGFTDQSGNPLFGELSEAYQQTLVEGVAAQQVLAADILQGATTDEALRKVYDANPDAFGQACVSHILVFAGSSRGQTQPTDQEYEAALAQIQRIQGELDGGASFADVARAESQDTGSAPSGGDLGCNPKGTYVTEFDDAVWQQPVGVVGPPVKTQYGYHLILVTSRTVPSFDEAKGQIQAAVQQNASSLVRAELAKVAATTTVHVDPRYGAFDASTGQITPPAGAEQPSTTTTSLADVPAANVQ